MAGMSVDGLVSGLSTSDLINQLIQAEAAPQTLLKTKVTAAQRVVSALQGVNTKFAALQTAAEALLKDETWSAVKASTTATSVTATATAGAPTGSLSLHVDQTAVGHALVFDTAVPGLDSVVASGSTLSVVRADGSKTVTLSGGKLSEVVDSINRSDAGVRAAAVKTAAGYRLQLTSTTTGAASSFSVTGVDGMGGQQDTSVGQDARVTIGFGTPAAYQVSSATNSFTGVMPGVTFAVATGNVDVTVNVVADPDAVASKVEAVVGAMNAALAEMKRATAYDVATKTGGALVGNSTVRSLAQSLAGLVDAVPGLGSLKQVGVELKKDGTVAFDKAAFLASLAKDPARTESFFTDGVGGTSSLAFSDRALGVARQATDKDTGLITMAVQGKDRLIKDLNQQVEAFDRKLVMRRTSLQRQFSAMEVALSSMKQQSNWLAGQIAGLPSASQ